MNLIETAIRSPVKTAVAVLLLMLFGGLALFDVPVQLTPTVEEAVVTVETSWPGASPAEIEHEIIDEQEEQLKALDGLLEMESSSQDSFGQIRLTFPIGSDQSTNMLKVANRLDQVQSSPATAEKPVLVPADTNASTIAWFSLEKRQGASDAPEVWTLYNFVNDEVKPLLERVPGVVQSNFYGGQELELQVIVDAARLASHQLTVGELAAALDRENRNISGGDFAEGKRRYVVRTVGEYRSPRDVEEVVVTVRDGVPITVHDVARVEIGYRKATTRSFGARGEMVAINAIKEPGANILDTMRDLKQAVADLNQGLLAERGLVMEQIYDQTHYLHSAIRLVRQSLLLGGLLAILALLVFLRSRSSALVVAVAIPISLAGTFLVMKILGRTLNVVSMAGMAFAIGMVVDNAIVVLENIYRHRQQGKSRFQAAHEGTREVWGAVLASTLTTIAVFVPILFVQEEAGQLFRDIALAIASGVALSLLVSITVIPCLAAKIIGSAIPGVKSPGDRERNSSSTGGPRQLWGLVGLARRLTDGIAGVVDKICRSTPRRWAVVASFTLASILLTVLLIPQAEYLPPGNMNFVFGITLPPPGYSLEEVTSFYDVFEDELSHLWKADDAAAVDLPGGGIRDFYFGIFFGRVALAATARDPLRAGELIAEIQKVNRHLPGTIAFAAQQSVFQQRGGGRSIDVEITGPDLLRLIELGGEVMGQIATAIPAAQAFPIPGLDLGNPEVHLRIDRRRAAELGISNRDLGYAVDALIDGAKATDYRQDGREIDLVIRGDETVAHRTHLLEQLPLSTSDGRLVTLGSVAAVEMVNGPVQINHRERQRTIKIQVLPPSEMPLQAAIDHIDSEVLEPMRQAGRIAGLYRATYSGSADKLTQTRRDLQWNLLLAVFITYLLMAALFESFLYPLVILFSLPLAGLGGFLGLGVLNLFSYQPLDILTMLGFIILVGTVVNNAILIVHQSLNLMRHEEMEPVDAIRESTRTRIRPIFMSVSTSSLAMLPLILFPGAGSELYRGLGSVVVGGLLVSTVFTLFLVPALFSLVLDGRAAFVRKWGHSAAAAEGTGI